MSKTLNELKEYLDYSDNWDGYGANKPNTKLILKLIIFIKFLISENITLPKVSLSSNGEIVLYWTIHNININIEYLNNNYFYYFQNNKSSSFLLVDDDHPINMNFKNDKTIMFLTNIIKNKVRKNE